MSHWKYSSSVKTWCLMSAAGVVATLSGCTVTVEQPAGYYYSRQPVAYSNPPPSAPVQGGPTDEQLQQLVAPIALYPDPILADVLPASTYPDQIQAAAQFVQANPQPSDDAIAAQPWAPSVQALVHYPTVLTYMSNDIPWTTSLGAAFATNQADVFAAVQDLRAQARAQGNLVSNAQIAVVSDGPRIVIEPADPTVIYIPVYDPVLVYQGPFLIGFGPRFFVGPWLGWGCDWAGGCVFVGDWHGPWFFDHGHWGYRAGWVRPYGLRVWAHESRWGPVHRWDARGFRAPVAFRGRVFVHGPARYVGGRGGYGTPEKRERDMHAAHYEARGARPEEHHEEHGDHGDHGDHERH